jgi:hypothetical protein
MSLSPHPALAPLGERENNGTRITLIGRVPATPTPRLASLDASGICFENGCPRGRILAQRSRPLEASIHNHGTVEGERSLKVRGGMYFG